MFLLASRSTMPNTREETPRRLRGVAGRRGHGEEVSGRPDDRNERRSVVREGGTAAIGRVATSGSGRVGRCRVRSRARSPACAREDARLGRPRSNAKRKGLRDRRARASRRALAGPRRTATHLLHLLLVMQRVLKHLLGALAHGHNLLVLLPQPLRLFLEPIGGRRGILERLRGPVHGLVHNRLGAFGFLEPVDVPRRLGGDRPTHVAQSAPPPAPSSGRWDPSRRWTYRAPSARLSIVLECFFATSRGFFSIRGHHAIPASRRCSAGSAFGRLFDKIKNFLTDSSIH